MIAPGADHARERLAIDASHFHGKPTSVRRHAARAFPAGLQVDVLTFESISLAPEERGEDWRARAFSPDSDVVGAVATDRIDGLPMLVSSLN